MRNLAGRDRAEQDAAQSASSHRQGWGRVARKAITNLSGAFRMTMNLRFSPTLAGLPMTYSASVVLFHSSVGEAALKRKSPVTGKEEDQ